MNGRFDCDFKQNVSNQIKTLTPYGDRDTQTKMCENVHTHFVTK